MSNGLLFRKLLFTEFHKNANISLPPPQDVFQFLYNKFKLKKDTQEKKKRKRENKKGKGKRGQKEGKQTKEGMWEEGLKGFSGWAAS